MSATFTVERSRTVQAPPEPVRALVEDFHAWFRRLDKLAAAASGPAGTSGT